MPPPLEAHVHHYLCPYTRHLRSLRSLHLACLPPHLLLLPLLLLPLWFARQDTCFKYSFCLQKPVLCRLLQHACMAGRSPFRTCRKTIPAKSRVPACRFMFSSSLSLSCSHASLSDCLLLSTSDPSLQDVQFADTGLCSPDLLLLVTFFLALNRPSTLASRSLLIEYSLSLSLSLHCRPHSEVAYATLSAPPEPLSAAEGCVCVCV